MRRLPGPLLCVAALASVASACAPATDAVVMGTAAAQAPVTTALRQEPVATVATPGSTPATTPATTPGTTTGTTTVAPAASMPPGFCPIQAGPVATYLRTDASLTPACLTVQANQAVHVTNAASAPVTVELDQAFRAVELPSGRAVTSLPLGALLVPATYRLVVGTLSAEVRLVGPTEP